MFGLRLVSCVPVDANPSMPHWTKHVRHWHVTIASGNGAAPMSLFYSKGTGRGRRAPTLSEILECLHAESTPDDTTFEEWCDMFEFNSDSISDRRRYRKMRSNTEHLMALMGENQWEDFLQITW